MSNFNFLQLFEQHLQNHLRPSYHLSLPLVSSGLRVQAENQLSARLVEPSDQSLLVTRQGLTQFKLELVSAQEAQEQLKPAHYDAQARKTPTLKLATALNLPQEELETKLAGLAWIVVSDVAQEQARAEQTEAQVASKPSEASLEQAESEASPVPENVLNLFTRMQNLSASLSQPHETALGIHDEERVPSFTEFKASLGNAGKLEEQASAAEPAVGTEATAEPEVTPSLEQYLEQVKAPVLLGLITQPAASAATSAAATSTAASTEDTVPTGSIFTLPRVLVRRAHPTVVGAQAALLQLPHSPTLTELAGKTQALIEAGYNYELTAQTKLELNLNLAQMAAKHQLEAPVKTNYSWQAQQPGPVWGLSLEWDQQYPAHTQKDQLEDLLYAQRLSTRLHQQRGLGWLEAESEFSAAEKSGLDPEVSERFPDLTPASMQQVAKAVAAVNEDPVVYLQSSGWLLAYVPDEQVLQLRYLPPLSTQNPHLQSKQVRLGRLYKLEVFFDVSVLEVYINDGELVWQDTFVHEQLSPVEVSFTNADALSFVEFGAVELEL